MTLFGDDYPRLMDEKTTRRCDGCDLCCTALEVFELRKPMGTRCSHLIEGRCAVYNDRPLTCRVFYCSWRASELLNMKIPQGLRPNDVGFVLHWNKGASPLMTLFVDPERPDAWKAHKKALKKIARSNDCAVVIGGGSEATAFVTPRGNWYYRRDRPSLFGPGARIGVPAQEFFRRTA